MTTCEGTLEGLAERDLAGFFVGWPTLPSPAKHLRLLHGSDFVVLARDTESGHVVGLVTAVGGGVLSAFNGHRVTNHPQGIPEIPVVTLSGIVQQRRESFVPVSHQLRDSAAPEDAGYRGSSTS